MDESKKEERFSKTFVFEKTVRAVDFIVEIDKYHFNRRWHDNEIRVTVLGKEIDLVDKIAADCDGLPKNDDDGKWRDVWK